MKIRKTALASALWDGAGTRIADRLEALAGGRRHEPGFRTVILNIALLAQIMLVTAAAVAG